jgi:hypothetical protein
LTYVISRSFLTFYPQNDDMLACFEEQNQLVYYDGTKSIVDSGEGVENVVSVGETLFYISGNNLHYHATNHGEFITLYYPNN